MNIQKRRFILLFILILALISVFFASNIISQVNAAGSDSTPTRMGEVYYLEKTTEIASYDGGQIFDIPELKNGLISWDDVLDFKGLLCREEDEPIPGRTQISGRKLDWRFYPRDDASLPILDFNAGTTRFRTLTEEFMLHLDEFDIPLEFDSDGNPMIDVDDMKAREAFIDQFKVSYVGYAVYNQVFGTYDFNISNRPYYISNSMSKYDETELVTCTPAEAYILAELGRSDFEVIVEIDIDKSEDEQTYYWEEWEEPKVIVYNDVEVETQDGPTGDRADVYSKGTGYTVKEGTDGNYYYVDESGNPTYLAGTPDGYEEGRSKAGEGSWIQYDYGDIEVETPIGIKPGGGSASYNPGPYYIKWRGRWYRVSVHSWRINIQVAWWGTQAGGGTDGNELTREAYAFEAYRNELNGKDYYPQWIIEGDTTELSVNTDIRDGQEGIKVGKFAIDYMYRYYRGSSRPFVVFAGIDDFVVYTDANPDVPLKLGEGFDFIYLEGEREMLDNTRFPKPDERFYIRLRQSENVRKIENIVVTFKYMDAEGQYMPLSGQYAEIHFSTTNLGWKVPRSPKIDGTISLQQLIDTVNKKNFKRIADAREFLLNNGETNALAKDYEEVPRNYESYKDALNRGRIYELDPSRGYIAILGPEDVVAEDTGVEMSGFWFKYENNQESAYYLYGGTIYTSTSNTTFRAAIIGDIRASKTRSIMNNCYDRETNTYEYNDETYDADSEEEVQELWDLIYPTVSAYESEIATEMEKYKKEPKVEMFTNISDANNRVVEYLTNLRYSHYKLKDSQALCWAANARKWYNYCELHRAIVLREGKVVIHKDVVDDDGESIAKLYNEESFNVRATIAGNTENLQVLAGKDVESTVYTWTGNNAPTYKVEEILPSDSEFELVKIENSEGRLDASKPIDVYITNKVKTVNPGKLKIEKVVEPILVGGTSRIIDGTFTFKIRLTGDFDYTDSKNVKHRVRTNPIEGSTAEDYVEDVIAITTENGKGSTEIAIDKIYGDKVHYTIEENSSDTHKVVSISQPQGYIGKSETTQIKVVNETDLKKASIEILKELSVSDGKKLEEIYTQREIMNMSFYFTIEVPGHSPIYTRATAYREDGKYIWKAWAGEFMWVAGENPTVTVTEDLRRLPKGITFEDAQAVGVLENFTVDKTKGKCSWKLTQGNENVAQVKFTNKVNYEPTYENRRISLSKTVLYPEGEEEYKLNNKTYLFKVAIAGTFEYNGVKYENKIIQIVNKENSSLKEVIELDRLDSKEDFSERSLAIEVKATTEYAESQKMFTERWISENIKWNSLKPAPVIYVAEDLTGENILHTVTADKISIDSLPTDGNDIISIHVENFDVEKSHVGYIKVVKELEDADKYTLEQLKQYEYFINVEVVYRDKDGNENPNDPRNTTLDMVLNEDNFNMEERIWEYEHKEPFMWLENEYPPIVTITEDTSKMPEGMMLAGYKNNQEETNDGTPEKFEMVESKQGEINYNIATVVNKQSNDVNFGYLKIKKNIVSDALASTKFRFNVKLLGNFYCGETFNKDEMVEEQNIVVEITGSGEALIKVWWYGDPGEGPEFYVTELENSTIYNNIAITGENGTIRAGDDKVSVAEFTNAPTLKRTGKKGINIKKQYEGQDTQTEYAFTVDITYYNTDGTEDPDRKETRIVFLKVEESVTLEPVVWYATEPNPTYVIREVLKEGQSEPTYEGCEGTFEDGSADIIPLTLATRSAGVIINNDETTPGGNRGYFEITKKVIEVPNRSYNENQEFVLRIDISGTFELEVDGSVKQVIAGNYTYTHIIKPGETYRSPEIRWWNNNAPKVTVYEDESTMPDYWDLAGIANNGAKLISGDTLKMTVTNIYGSIDLTMSLEGDVWEDEPKDQTDKAENYGGNGKFDRGIEKGIPGVEVYVYVYNENGTRKLATVYEDITNKEVTQPIITSGDGHWAAPRLDMSPGTRYYVEFVYDGQTYETTTFLATSNGSSISAKANEYIANNIDDLDARNAKRNEFQDDSMGIEVDRQDVNNKMAIIFGNMPIDGKRETIGTATATDNTKNNLYYKGNEDISITNRLSSKLQTKDENGNVYEMFKATASTIDAGLAYPFDDMVSLNDENVEIRSLDQQNFTVVSETYSAAYEYCHHVNLGLTKRRNVDIGATKALQSAKLEMNGQTVEYKFNQLQDIGSDYIQRQIDKDAGNQLFNIGLYSTGYYYRAELYQKDADLFDAMQGFDGTSTIEKSIEQIKDQQLKIKLEYDIDLYNSSIDYQVKIHSINDYVEESLGMPIETKIGNTVVNANWQNKGTIVGSDGLTYRKLSLDLNNTKLASGAHQTITVVFEVEKSLNHNVRESIELGTKSNIVEIGSYTTYYSDGTTIAGKADGDSAPDNVNIRSYNEVNFYEDDTDAAAVLELKLKDDTRNVEGTAWEDQKEDGSTGNGKFENDEARIAGLTTQLIEKITINSKTYDFLWPTNKPLEVLGGKSIEQLTGFDSSIETYRTQEKSEDGKIIHNAGDYKFKGVPGGNYVVRFIYGTNKMLLDDLHGVTGSPVAVNAEGGKFYDKNDNILVANYDDELYGYTPAVYNGQDFKSTIYLAGITASNLYDSDGYINNIFHNLEWDTEDLSSAKDDELRRLELIEKAETLVNAESSILDTANYLDENHLELYNNYNIFADTATMNLTREALADVVDSTNNVISTSGSGTGITLEETVFDIPNINFGLIERPETRVVLDKQISGIRIITNDQKTVFDAKYNIEYKVVTGQDNAMNKTIVAKLGSSKFLIAEVTLNTEESVGIDVLQEINKIEDKDNVNENNIQDCIQNFRYINVDDTILQGATIEIDYKLTALNVSELDYTSDKLAMLQENVITSNKEATSESNVTTVRKELRKLIDELAVEKNTEDYKYGQYLGQFYYTGNTEGQEIVSTRVRQVIDFIDNDAVFTQNKNTSNNHLWRNTTITELLGSGYNDQRLIDKKVLPGFELEDKFGISYITETSNNLVLNVDNVFDINNQETTNNSEFTKQLIPFAVSNDANSDSYKGSIELTISKVIAAEDDANDMVFDNLAEIVKIENTVGRRDMAVVSGDSNPKEGEFEASVAQRDSSATELVTFTPPTGGFVYEVIKRQMYIVILLALIILAVGTVIIKEKVVPRKRVIK